jgi:hypothetical protein
MNFGYPNTPYASNMSQEGYMGNVGMNPMMDYMQPQTMPYGMGMGGCGQQSCNQVVQQMATVDMPYYVNYNTHVINNVVRRHIQIPVYSQTQETIYFDEWQQGCGCGCNR